MNATLQNEITGTQLQHLQVIEHNVRSLHPENVTPVLAGELISIVMQLAQSQRDLIEVRGVQEKLLLELLSERGKIIEALVSQGDQFLASLKVQGVDDGR